MEVENQDALIPLKITARYGVYDIRPFLDTEIDATDACINLCLPPWKGFVKDGDDYATDYQDYDSCSSDEEEVCTCFACYEEERSTGVNSNNDDSQYNANSNTISRVHFFPADNYQTYTADADESHRFENEDLQAQCSVDEYFPDLFDGSFSVSNSTESPSIENNTYIKSSQRVDIKTDEAGFSDTVPSITMSFRDTQVHVAIATGSTSNLIKASYAYDIGLPIHPDLTYHEEMEAVKHANTIGIVFCNFTKNGKVFHFDALAVVDLNVDVCVGMPFLVQYDVMIRPAKQLIIIDDEIVPYTCISPSLPEGTHNTPNASDSTHDTDTYSFSISSTMHHKDTIRYHMNAIMAAMNEDAKRSYLQDSTYKVSIAHNDVENECSLGTTNMLSTSQHEGKCDVVETPMPEQDRTHDLGEDVSDDSISIKTLTYNNQIERWIPPDLQDKPSNDSCDEGYILSDGNANMFIQYNGINGPNMLCSSEITQEEKKSGQHTIPAIIPTARKYEAGEGEMEHSSSRSPLYTDEVNNQVDPCQNCMHAFSDCVEFCDSAFVGSLDSYYYEDASDRFGCTPYVMASSCQNPSVMNISHSVSYTPCATISGVERKKSSISSNHSIATHIEIKDISPCLIKVSGSSQSKHESQYMLHDGMSNNSTMYTNTVTTLDIPHQPAWTTLPCYLMYHTYDIQGSKFMQSKYAMNLTHPSVIPVHVLGSMCILATNAIACITLVQCLHQQIVYDTVCHHLISYQQAKHNTALMIQPTASQVQATDRPPPFIF